MGVPVVRAGPVMELTSKAMPPQKPISGVGSRYIVRVQETDRQRCRLITFPLDPARRYLDDLRTASVPEMMLSSMIANDNNEFPVLTGLRMKRLRGNAVILVSKAVARWDRLAGAGQVFSDFRQPAIPAITSHTSHRGYNEAISALM